MPMPPSFPAEATTILPAPTRELMLVSNVSVPKWAPQALPSDRLTTAFFPAKAAFWKM